MEAIGQILTIALYSKQIETYALRMLYHIRGPKSFEDLSIVDGINLPKF